MYHVQKMHHVTPLHFASITYASAIIYLCILIDWHIQKLGRGEEDTCIISVICELTMPLCIYIYNFRIISGNYRHLRLF